MIWLVLNFVSLIILAFYSMIEMACVSFSKVRLQYYISKKNRRAMRLKTVLEDSSRLFGTTLIGVNVAMIFGSEFARQFHESIGVSPDLSPLSQAMIVIILGELAPLFAARRYAEHMALLGANILYYSSLIMAPALICISAITKLVHKLIGGVSETFNLYLNQEEIRKVLEERHEETASGSPEELNTIVSNIFDLRKKTASVIMTPIRFIAKVSTHTTIQQIRQLLLNTSQPYLLVYHRHIDNIVGIVYPRDLLRIADDELVHTHAKAPWFISDQTEVVHILHQFRNNTQSVAIVFNDKGRAIGVVSLQDVIEEIFGKASLNLSKEVPLIERTFPGNMSVQAFNEMFHVALPTDLGKTLADLIASTTGHQPEEGESIILPPFELKVKEATLMEVKSITIKTRLT